ncbi:MAG: hypothetical protein ACT4OY_03425 [Alphaproteobacteria bacterium]
MRTRLLLTSVAAAALFTVVGASAVAQPAGFYESRTPWAVSKVAGDGGRNSYCAMAKQFSQDVILTIARNLNGESSFAIDFQAPRLLPTSIVSVTLDPGAGQQRSYNLQPISSKALVVRLGNDGPFFDAIKKTGFLRFEIDDKSYSFNVADMNAGDMKLDACIASSVMPAAGDTTPSIAAAPAPAVQGQALADDSYRQEINALRASIHDLQAQNAKMATAPTPAPAPVVASTLTPMPAQATPLYAAPVKTATASQINAQSAAPVVDTHVVNALQSENTRLKNELAGLQQVTSHATDQMAALSVEINRLKTEGAGLTAQLAAKQNADAGMMQTARVEIETLKAENVRLLTGSQSQANVVADLQAQLKNLELQNTALTQKTVAAGQFAERMAALEAENNALKTQVSATQAAAAGQQAASADIEKLRRENAGLQAQINQFEMHKTNGSDQLKALDSENRRLKAQISQMEGQVAEISTLRQAVALMAQESKTLAIVRQDVPAPVVAQVAPIQAVKAPQIDIGALQNDIVPQAGGPEPIILADSEAEDQERSLMQSLNAPVQEEEKITVRASEDPYAVIPSQDNFTGYELHEDSVMEEQAPVVAPAAPAPLAATDLAEPAAAAMAVVPPAFEPSPAYVPQTVSAVDTPGLTPSELRVRRRNNMAVIGNAALAAAPVQMELPFAAAPMPVPVMPMQEELARPPVMAASPPPSMPAQPVPQAIAAAPPPPAAPAQGVYQPGVSIQTILSDAGILNGEQVELVSQASDSQQAAYQWKSSDVYGSAVQEPMANESAFDQQVKEYLEKTQARCTGEFAVSPDGTQQVGDRRIDSYEIACISPDVNSSASIVFFSIDGTFTAVAHESPTAQLQTAMEIRDRLVREISGS